jgi:hypothetical protein
MTIARAIPTALKTFQALLLGFAPGRAVGGAGGTGGGMTQVELS